MLITAQYHQLLMVVKIAAKKKELKLACDFPHFNNIKFPAPI